MTKYMERNKILVVDDEEDLCEILQFNLESEGFAVDIANSAEEALKLLTDEHELILLDVMMEGMSGFKMAEKVRKEMHMNTPIIFLTAKDTENRRRRLYRQTLLDQRSCRPGKSSIEKGR